MTTVLPPYPSPVDALIPAGRTLAEQLGRIPSRNELMRRLRIGAEKARRVRAELAAPTDPWAYAEPATGLADPPAVPGPEAGTVPGLDVAPPAPAAEPSPQASSSPDPGSAPGPAPVRRVAVWPLVLLALPAFVAVWSGWVGLGRMTGFGMVDLLPGIVEPGSWATIDSAITLPVGVETYAAYALYVWLSGRVPDRARRFARWSALGSLAVGALGQVAYHLLAASGVTSAPWQITTAVACLPVAVLGMGAALAHLVRHGH